MTAGILGSTLLTAATTIDDAVWLIPYCTANHLPKSTQAIHAMTFILTLQVLALGCVIFSSIFSKIVNQRHSSKDSSFILGVLGALMCWSIAIFLYVKKMRKRRRHILRKALNETILLAKHLVQSKASTEETPLVESNDYEKEFGGTDANAHAEDEMSSSTDSSESSTHDQLDGNDIPIKPSIRMVMMLTTLGALDEISYFPALLMGNVFSPTQLLIGTFLASILILVIVLRFLSRVKPLVDFLDGIPLYAIVGMFAIILTVGLIFD